MKFNVYQVNIFACHTLPSPEGSPLCLALWKKASLHQIVWQKYFRPFWTMKSQQSSGSLLTATWFEEVSTIWNSTYFSGVGIIIRLLPRGRQAPWWSGAAMLLPLKLQKGSFFILYIPKNIGFFFFAFKPLSVCTE